jgi:hypothetical protein
MAPLRRIVCHHMKPLTNLINVATGIIMHQHLDRLPKQIIILDICNHQITLSLIEVFHLLAYHLSLMHIRVMVPDMVLVALPTHLLLPGPTTFIQSLSVDHIPCQDQYLLIQ